MSNLAKRAEALTELSKVLRRALPLAKEICKTNKLIRKDDGDLNNRSVKVLATLDSLAKLHLDGPNIILTHKVQYMHDDAYVINVSASLLIYCMNDNTFYSPEAPAAVTRAELVQADKSQRALMRQYFQLKGKLRTVNALLGHT